MLPNAPSSASPMPASPTPTTAVPSAPQAGAPEKQVSPEEVKSMILSVVEKLKALAGQYGLNFDELVSNGAPGASSATPTM